MSSLFNQLLEDLKDDSIMVESIKKVKISKKSTDDFERLARSGVLDHKGPSIPGKLTPAKHSNEVEPITLKEDPRDLIMHDVFFNPLQFDYFITIAFPQKQKFNIKHLEIRAQNQEVYVFKPIPYEECTQKEQYSFIKHKLSIERLYNIADIYDLFFEVTKNGNIHIHGRLYSIAKKSIKDIKLYLHRLFEVKHQLRHFIDIKPYDHLKWNDYDKKNNKAYQTCTFPHLTNIIKYLDEKDPSTWEASWKD